MAPPEALAVGLNGWRGALGAPPAVELSGWRGALDALAERSALVVGKFSGD